ncbi:50S ribosomal protein L13 [Candidatus Saccharibacteria bacterium]|nr:50S ribosomal protein L13 [Candidatus Saccharibacteria bacterium]
MPKTYSAKPTDVTRAWYVVDAATAPLGRLATEVAFVLMGKQKPMYTPHIDCGDYVVVINADKLVVTGDKKAKKTYYRHTGFPGGIKDETLQEKLDKDSTQVIVKAVRGMMPANKLRDGRLARLKVYAGTEHEHTAQKPTALTLKEAK